MNTVLQSLRELFIDKTIKNVKYNLFLFTFGSIGGWVIETIFRSLYSGYLVIPGFLNGPWCPIYGLGITLAIHLCEGKNVADSFIRLFAGATILECVTSVFFERFTHRLLWDYSIMPLSTGSRINIIFSILWGLMGLFLLYVIEPQLKKFFECYPAFLTISECLVVFFFIDCIIKFLLVFA